MTATGIANGVARWSWRIIVATAAVFVVLMLLGVLLFRPDEIELAEPPEDWVLLEPASEPFPDVEVVGGGRIDAELRAWQPPDSAAMLNVVRFTTRSSQGATLLMSGFRDDPDAGSACGFSDNPYVHDRCSSASGVRVATIMWQQHNVIMTVNVEGQVADPVVQQFVDDQLALVPPTAPGAPRDFRHRVGRIVPWVAPLAAAVVGIAISKRRWSRQGEPSLTAPEPHEAV